MWCDCSLSKKYPSKGGMGYSNKSYSSMMKNREKERIAHVSKIKRWDHTKRSSRSDGNN
jgi:hypothetical protein